MRLAIDIDGCCADFVTGWSTIYERWWPGRLDHTKLVEWEGIITATHFQTEDEFWAWTDDARVWENLPVVVGAQGTLYDLRDAGHEIAFVTSRHPMAQFSTNAWLSGRFPFVYGVAYPGKEKWKVEADLYLDDNPEVLWGLKMNHRPACRFVRPWNNVPLMNQVPFKIREWSEFPAVVTAVEEALA